VTKFLIEWQGQVVIVYLTIPYLGPVTMNVNFHLPDTPALRNGVRAIFQTDGFPGFSNETILPKGCTEIIFDLSESQSIERTNRQ
jgi:hypothetical protein